MFVYSMQVQMVSMYRRKAPVLCGACVSDVIIDRVDGSLFPAQRLSDMFRTYLMHTDWEPDHIEWYELSPQLVPEMSSLTLKG
jgi:hypothetical protein